ncbi:DUF285 domain-containing protein [Acinetobacter johnsonii]|nr:DUF285 domain-containing protein [Acinetobacter johnsonii]
MHEYNGSNPLLDALGDEPSVKVISMTNTYAYAVKEPLTQVLLKSNEVTVIQVTGAAALEQIISNLEQINALKANIIQYEIHEPENSANAMVMRVSEEADSVTLAIGGGPFQINWGDGAVEVVTEGYVTHEYATRAEWRIVIDKEQGSVSPSRMELGTAVGIKEIIAWWGDGYEALRLIDSEEDMLRDKLVKVPSIAPKVFPLERGEFAPIFAACTQINDPNISEWDVSAWPNLGGMFQLAQAFNQPLDNWDVSNVVNMNGIFQGAIAFDQDLSMWCVAKVLSEPEGFATGTALQPEHMPVWGTCPVE